jgi:diacylglycerol O-acyltransferase / wax synthase
MAERLSLVDASFLTRETPRTPLHAGGVAVFEPGLTFAGVMDVLRRRLAAVPLARKRVREVAFGAGRPVWVDDDHFDLSYHLRHAQLPPPGGQSALEEFCARLVARPLDRSRPLWELYVIGGLEGDRTALFRKVHLAISGGENDDPFGVLLDDRADLPDPGPAMPDRWEPEAGPGTASLAVSAVRDRLQQAAGAGRAVVATAADPRRLAGSATAAASSAVGLLGRVIGGAPPSPLNRRLTPPRLYGLARADLDDFRRIRRIFGGSINDIVVAAVADAVGQMLRGHGYDTKDLDLRAMVPVRVHGEELDAESGPLGQPRMVDEGVVAVLCPLPVMEIDAVAGQYRVIRALCGLSV